MSTSTLESMEFAKYFRSLENVLPDARAFGVCDEHGLRWHDDQPGSAEALKAAIEKLSKEDPAWHACAETIRSQRIDEATHAYVAGISEFAGEPAGALLVLAEGEDEAAAINQIEPVAQCLRDEMRLTAELNSMTAELTERYEELNLVYHTEDQVNLFREGRDALTNLVDNCNDYLNVGLTALILKSKKIEIIRNSPVEPIRDSQIVATRLQEELYAWIEANNEIVVVNDVTDPRATDLLRGVPYKLLCSPVVDGSGTVAGMLAIVNHYSRPDFSNSDKNLLSVMARKAGKIIQTNYDALTGLVNRGGFEYFLESALDDVRGTSRQHCVLHVNIDQLSVVNDTASHHAGDEVIRQVVGQMSAHLRETDTLARIGGDRFGVLLENCSDGHGKKIGEQIRSSVQELVVEFGGREHDVTISIGISALTADTPDLTAALAGAELACGESSDLGGNRIEVYHDENSELVQRHRQMQLVEKIQRAVSEDQFVLYGQPIVPIRDRDAPHHYEILLRMLDGDEIVSPGLFVPAAERYHMMPAVDRWVVAQTLARLAELPADVLQCSVFAINLSGQSLGETGFLEFLSDSLAGSSVPNRSICFEVTETAAIQNLASAKQFVTTLSATGCQFALDDFGVGLSSFSYLKSLPVDQLKIDGEFVKDLLNDSVSAAMVAAINQVGQTLGLKTVAEFVENEAIRDALAEMGIDYAQGFGICKPLPFDVLLAELLEQRAAIAS